MKLKGNSSLSISSKWVRLTKGPQNKEDPKAQLSFYTYHNFYYVSSKFKSTQSKAPTHNTFQSATEVKKKTNTTRVL